MFKNSLACIQKFVESDDEIPSYVECWGCSMLGMWDVGVVECSGCGMLGMWDVGVVGCSGCGMWDIRNMGCWGCGMLGVLGLWDV